MKISSAPVSYQTHVRPAQVRDMMRCCDASTALSMGIRLRSAWRSGESRM